MARKVLLTILSSFLAILVFPPFQLFFLAPVAWIPLFLALKGASLRASFRIGLLHGFLCFAGTLCWMFVLFGTLAPVLWLMLACFTALFGVAFHFLEKFQLKGSPLTLATLWTGIEYYRSELFILDFPWITPGTGLPPNLLTPVIGVYGVSFFLVLTGLLLIQQLDSRPERPRWKPTAVFLLFWVLMGSQIPKIHKPTYLVALIQNEEYLLDTHLEMSEPHAGNVDAIVWPEYAVAYDPSVHPRGKEITELLKENTQLLVLGGRQDQEDSHENTSFTLGKEGLLGTHVKNHPVHLFDDGIAGTTAIPIDTPLGKVGTPICFDCDYQDVIRRMTANGAEFFLIPSLDAIAWTERQHLQHAELFRHRAAENGRWLAVAATSGQTQIISPSGHQTETLPLIEKGTLVGGITPRSTLTLFTMGGWLIGPICFSLTLLSIPLLVIALYRQRKFRSLESASS